MTLQANFENYVYVVHDTPTPPRWHLPGLTPWKASPFYKSRENLSILF